MTSIFIAMPAERGQITTHAAASLAHTCAELRARGIAYQFVPQSDGYSVSWKRNVGCGDFLWRTEHTHLLFWDSDIIAPTDLIPRMLECDVDIIGAAYCKKGDAGALPLVQQLREKDPPDRAMLRCDFLAPGFALFRRAALERADKSYPELRSVIPTAPSASRPQTFDIPVPGIFNEILHRGILYGEDGSFFIRWDAIGGETFVMREAWMGHVDRCEKVWWANLATSLAEGLPRFDDLLR
jgi:hypothetical protein